MKLKEKLAEEAFWATLERAGKFDIAKEVFHKAYQLGFEKAREIAIDTTENYAHVELCKKGKCSAYHSPCDLVHDLMQLGEEEVE